MPPFIPRKRSSTSPPAVSRPTPSKRAKLVDVLDADEGNTSGLQRKKTFSVGGSDNSDSSLSDVDSDQFEDAKPTGNPQAEDDEDEEEDIEWEDAGGHDHHQDLPEYKPQSDGPIEITLRKRDDEGENWLEQAATKIKKAASKRDKQVRVCTHQLHVQFLLWHNSIRNRWISDRKLQHILVQQLPPPLKKEVEKWKRASGLTVPGDHEERDKRTQSKRRGKQKATDPRKERDWGRPSQRLEPGAPDMSHGDPLISLMKVLAAYWKKRFSITAPGLRKRGYGTGRELRQTLYSQKHDEHDPEIHGERVRTVEEFRQLAKKCEGSRDVGAQLFTALLRGLGIEARLVASLQPSGYGWTKAEQMLPRKPVEAVNIDTSSDESDSDNITSISDITKSSGRRKGKVNAAVPQPADELDEDEDDDDSSVVEVVPSKQRKLPQKYDRDHPFPIYWTEAISPITNKILPVSPIVLPSSSVVATTPEILAAFEPRGAKAEKTKTVMAYVIAYSSDGTAKDVTVRYLKKHVWPGKTKGFRFPVEKIPVYNNHGKVKRYEDYDWFKRIMSSYGRPDLMRTVVDDIEDATDLVPQLPDQKNTRGQEVDTLQSLKASADYVLERFLRREEALRPSAQPVRTFASGKGDNIKEEPVYLRSDVERCLTAESWHKEGRRPKAGEAPMKLVPVRAVTITRKREAEEHERQTGEKQMQGLYSWDQTEYIIPPPIVDGIIPKNAYGNIDCFVPSMVPRGAAHIALRGTVRICKKLEIDFAEAVTGFEFGNKRAVPICTGVVVAKENERTVRDAWRQYNEEQRRKEEKKLEAVVLETWRKFVIGLRIRERVRDTYGEGAVDELIVGRSAQQPIMLESDSEERPMRSIGNTAPIDDEFEGGGFLPESDEEHAGSDLEVVDHRNDETATKSSLLNEPISKGKERAAETQYPTPSSVSPLKPPVRRRRPTTSLRHAHSRDADEESELSDLASTPLSGVGESDGDDDVVDTSIHTQEDEDPSDEEEADSDQDDEDESDVYRPSRSTPRARRQKRTAPSTITQKRTRASTRTSARVKKAANVPPSSSRDDFETEQREDTGIDADIATSSRPRATHARNKNGLTPASTPKHQRQTLKHGNTIVTSPYFNAQHQ